MTIDTEQTPVFLHPRRTDTFTLKEIVDLVGVPLRVAFLMEASGMTEQEEMQETFIALASLRQQLNRNAVPDAAGVRLRLLRLEERGSAIRLTSERGKV